MGGPQAGTGKGSHVVMSIVGAARVDRVWEKKLRENYLTIVGETAPSELEACVRGLEKHVEKNVPEKNRVQCDVCLGWSDEGLDSCPYCADEGPPAETPVPAESGVIDVQAEVVETKDETAIDATAIEAGGVTLEEPKKGKGKKDKKTAAEVAETKAPKPMPELPKPSAPLVNVPLAPMVANEKELDAALDRYRKASESTANGLYLMGVEIAKIHDHLWQQRLEGGKPKYKSWSQFVATELTISVPYANRLKQVVEKFSEDDFNKYGAKALMVMAAAPKEDHAQLMSKADSGATTRELDAEVRKIREAKGITVVENESKEGASSKGKRQTQKATEAAAASRAKKESAAITLGLKSETFKVKMFAKPASEKLPHQKAECARTLEDQPYGKVECINGVTLFLAIQVTPSGEIEIRGTAKREDDEE